MASGQLLADYLKGPHPVGRVALVYRTLELEVLEHGGECCLFIGFVGRGNEPLQLRPWWRSCASTQAIVSASFRGSTSSCAKASCAPGPGRPPR